MNTIKIFVCSVFLFLLSFNAFAYEQSAILHYSMAINKYPLCEPANFSLPQEVECTKALRNDNASVCRFAVLLKCGDTVDKVTGFYEVDVSTGQFTSVEVD